MGLCGRGSGALVVLTGLVGAGGSRFSRGVSKFADTGWMVSPECLNYFLELLRNHGRVGVGGGGCIRVTGSGDLPHRAREWGGPRAACGREVREPLAWPGRLGLQQKQLLGWT